ncbi:MAG TPA: formylmethanofuran dehydrogenase subunit C [Gammaproteobacteria bacterium]|nr:formylmethanofuran dehydrogenase subunit C [Gammaproteobacteria bacterium]
MSLQLNLHTLPEVPLEAELLSPESTNGLDADAVAAINVQHGNEKAEVGDFFKVSGQGNGELQLEGDLSRIKYIGAAMQSGTVRIEGNVGAHLGAAMSGGEIHVHGNAADWVGPEMTGGRITVSGDAGHMVGSAYRGSTVGMQGGEIIIHGNARNEIGHAMRNGMIMIGGNCGDFAGVNMNAGTILVLGEPGIRAGAGMKRGSIVTMQQPELLPTFSYSCLYQPTFMRLFLQYAVTRGLPVQEEQLEGEYQRWCGDAVELNRGEILIFAG